ncbi:hypothetical protein SLP22_0080 [Salmonella phage BAU.Micro_SLP-22]|nr:hypothetical protein SLP22_00001 [Salmonella phage BAU.Micro_SLP-22]
MINPNAKRVTVFIQSMVSDDLIIVAVYGETPEEVKRQAVIAYAEQANELIDENFRFDDAQELFLQSAVFRGFAAGQPLTVWNCDGVDLTDLELSGLVTVFVDQPFRDLCDPYVTVLDVPAADAIPHALAEEYRTHTGGDLEEHTIAGVMAGGGALRWCAWSDDLNDDVIAEVIAASPSYAELSA